ncbi:hypothetical protein [Leuconostoc mesenteroides]|uniref:hypothetical protein n=1 Tax=Leuconostoc mesenteroides TaxID=1245 RepID=UPI001FBABF04|nr:hypothetical protein [Leuconostoc mesenteroides]MCJ2158605.1 hypothetical protein [Leuconostoc mesenteroides]MCM6835970.1 hypothetical protein [Leuconostoc mesenteroides]
MKFLGLEIGSWADLLGAVGTISAVALALWQLLFGIQREQRIKAKKTYAKDLVKNVLNLKSNVGSVKQIFIVENHPVAREEWEMDGSNVDTITKASSELESDIYILIDGVEGDIKLAHIDNFISDTQEHNLLTKLECIKTNLIGLFKSIKSTESIFMEIATRREVNAVHGDLTREEKTYFDKTTADFDVTKKEIEELEQTIKTIFY